MSQVSRRPLLPIFLIMLALIIWGILHALGTYLFRETYDYRKPLIVLVCVGGFVSFWAVLLVMRQRRQSSSTSTRRHQSHHE